MLNAYEPDRSSAAPTGSSTAVDALARAITSEVRLLEDLIGVMRRQRKAVGTDDLQGVDDSVFATHRILVTLSEARRQRRALGRFLGGSEDLALRALEDLLGDRMTDTLRDARDGLRAVALTLSREVEMNRYVLREALTSGNDYVRALYGPGDAAAYSSNGIARSGKEAVGGFLLNRKG